MLIRTLWRIWRRRNFLKNCREDELIRKEKEREDYYKRLEALRAIPKDKLTENQKRALQFSFVFSCHWQRSVRP